MSSEQPDDFEGDLWWVSPIGDVQRIIVDGQQVTFEADSEGRMQASFRVPIAVPVDRMPQEMLRFFLGLITQFLQHRQFVKGS